MNSWLRSLRVIVPVALFLAIASTAYRVSANEGNDYASDSRGEEICEYVDLAHRKIGFSGSVLVARDGEVIATASRGFADLEKKVPNSKQTLFEIASCTKPFTAIAVMKLAETGKLSLDDPITKHLPHVPENCRAITVRHLLAHTSGIPGTNIDGRGTDLAEVIPSFLEGGPKHPPGKHFEYWNQGYALLSEVVARVSGQTFNDFVRQEIFRPSSMDHSQFTGDTAIEGTIAAVGESIEGKSRSALEPPYGTGLQYSGMGGIVTNVEDLWNWDRAIANQTLISGVWLKKMTVRGLGGHGMGWTVRSGPDGKLSHGHDGIVRGFSAEIWRYPSDDGVIIILANQDEKLPTLLLHSGIERILFRGPDFPQTASREMIDRVRGEYFDHRNRRLVISGKGRLPSVNIYWGGPITYGYLGIDESGTTQLYMMGTGRLKADGPLAFSPEAGQCKSVTLPSIKLTFTRKKQ